MLGLVKKRWLGPAWGILSALLLGGKAWGQGQPLLVVDGDTVTAGEFLYSYQKNQAVRGNENTLALEPFLESYVDYRLKVADGRRMHLDTVRQYREEYERYRSAQLASMILDSAAVEAAYRAAYGRMLREVDASHILVAITPGRSQNEALRVALQLRDQLLKGADFAALARRESDDMSAKWNGGRLGYFSAFTMVLPFELAAYALPVGDVSEPILTRFGYHLIKIHGVRPSRGRMRVGHISMWVPDSAMQVQRDSARAAVERAYVVAKAGGSFDSLMRKYNPSAYAVGEGERYPWVSAGNVPVWFYDKAFSLHGDGEISQPFESPLGWHIVKRIAYEPVPPYGEARERLRVLMRQSGEMVDDERAFIAAVRRMEGARVDDSAGAVLSKRLMDLNREKARSDPFDGLVVGEANGEKLSANSFFHWTIGRGIALRDMHGEAVQRLVEQFVDAVAVELATKRLASENPQFGYLVHEFRDGLLLFEVSERKVWAASLNTEDTLREYYKLHRKELFFDTCFSVEEYSAGDLSDLLPIADRLRKGKKLGISRRAMERAGITMRDMRLGTDHPLMRGYATGKALGQKSSSNGAWSEGCLGPLPWRGGGKLYRVVKRQILVPMSYEESRPEIIARLQKERERRWVESLRRECAVEINTEAVQWAKRQLEER